VRKQKLPVARFREESAEVPSRAILAQLIMASDCCVSVGCPGIAQIRSSIAGSKSLKIPTVPDAARMEEYIARRGDYTTHVCVRPTRRRLAESVPVRSAWLLNWVSAVVCAKP
jgi:hypothetical protein